MLHLSLPDFWDFEQRWCRFSTCTGEMHIFHMTEKTQQLAPSVYIHQVILKQYMINVQFYFLPLVLPFLKLPCNPLLTSSGCCEPLDSHLISAFTNETPSNKEKKERKKTKQKQTIVQVYLVTILFLWDQLQADLLCQVFPTWLPPYSSFSQFSGMSKRWHKGT